MSKLRFYRLELGLSQIELSEATGIARWVIQLMEVGVRCPNECEVQAITAALGIDAHRLFPSPLTMSNNNEVI